MSTTVKLKIYSGEVLAVKGSMTVHIHYGSQEANLLISVVKDDGPNLLGHDWL